MKIESQLMKMSSSGRNTTIVRKLIGWLMVIFLLVSSIITWYVIYSRIPFETSHLFDEIIWGIIFPIFFVFYAFYSLSKKEITQRIQKMNIARLIFAGLLLSLIYFSLILVSQKILLTKVLFGIIFLIISALVGLYYFKRNNQPTGELLAFKVIALAFLVSGLLNIYIKMNYIFYVNKFVKNEKVLNATINSITCNTRTRRSSAYANIYFTDLAGNKHDIPWSYSLCKKYPDDGLKNTPIILHKRFNAYVSIYDSFQIQKRQKTNESLT